MNSAVLKTKAPTTPTSRASELQHLEEKDAFVRRHIGPREDEIADMLKYLGVKSLDDLTARVVPASIRENSLPDVPDAAPEHEVLARLKATAHKNKVFRSLIGLGYYGTITPNVILRNVLENPGWYTAYTPYQPEISQGRLEALLNFQQMVSDLTALPVSNASLLDEATAAAEAMTLAKRASQSQSLTFLVADDCHPQTIAVVETRAKPLGLDVIVCKPSEFSKHDAYGWLLQYPGTNGEVADYSDLIKQARAKDVIVTMATDLLALTLLTPPGELGADIAIGSAQRFGVPMGAGGPHAAFMAVRDDYKRSMPGRLVGVSVDRHGKPALRLALQTREQHIRREKATSNICTSQVLLANIASFYAVWHGPDGLTKIARRTHLLASILAEGLEKLGFKIDSKHFFDTLTVETGGKAKDILERANYHHINLRDFGSGRLGIALDEKSTAGEVETLWEVFSGKENHGLLAAGLEKHARDRLHHNLKRTSKFLTHPVFNTHHSETEMLRYLRRLEHKDIALNRAMIPLGSCTMKLNATAEMIPVTWPEFGGIHPYAPSDQTKGYQQMVDELETWLAKLTGFAKVSIQPNAGSQGEYAGLLAIRAWHESRKETSRDICLIPASAHGTNPASAVMAGMKVVVVACDDKGNIDVADLKKKAEEHKTTLAALMVTYPSTHGVFEESIRDICDIVHKNGGQVYMDGANFNAMVGLAAPGKFGADVMHLNLHKTFCIPHGGGGPGVGPVCVARHLVPFLPGNPISGKNPVSAAPWGSASILPISWVYIHLMGAQGLKKATEVAILSANYLAKKLAGGYETLYKGTNGFVAHECILDTRDFKNTAGISVDDIAKRLMDYGFHAPTMSFPVPGTLMVEPTESEPKAELERFITALSMIREEIRKVEKGEWPRNDNPLVNAPHTAEEVTATEWKHAYPREVATFPVASLKGDKYWPPVGRIDNAAGDRNLVCTCPPVEAYQ